jgi:hypothetical protein
MNRWLFLVVCLALFGGALFIAFPRTMPAAEPAKEAAPPAVGRYQMVKDERNNRDFLLLDTATGRVWVQGREKWDEYIAAPTSK